MGINDLSDTGSSLSTPVGQGTDNRPNTVLRQNITTGQLVGDIVASTLGPCGRDVLIYNRDDHEQGDTEFFEVTNSGSFVLNRLSFEAPAAEVVARIAKAQDDRCGDATTTTAIYAGRIFAEIESLIDQGLHPTTVIAGIDTAVSLACDAIDEYARPMTRDDSDLIDALVRTAVSGRLGDVLVDELSSSIRAAAKSTTDDSTFSPAAVQTESLRSGTVSDSELIQGMVLKKSFAGQYDPEYVDSPRIAIATQGIARAQQIRQRLEGNSEHSDEVVYEATDVDDRRDFSEYERDVLRKKLRPLVEADIDVLLVSNRVENDVIKFFDAEEIAVVREADRGRLRTLAEATGATVNKYLEGFEDADVGHAGSVERRRYAEIEQNALLFRDCPNSLIVSALVHGSTWASSWEAERSVNSAVAAVSSGMKKGQVVPGGGAVELAVSRRLREAASSHGDRESLVIEAVADALEAVPKTLARNTGMKPVDTLISLRNSHHHGDVDTGVLPLERTIGNVVERGVLEPAFSKRNAIQAAGSVVETVLRIDDTVTGVGPSL